MTDREAFPSRTRYSLTRELYVYVCVYEVYGEGKKSEPGNPIVQSAAALRRCGLRRKRERGTADPREETLYRIRDAARLRGPWSSRDFSEVGGFRIVSVRWLVIVYWWRLDNRYSCCGGWGLLIVGNPIQTQCTDSLSIIHICLLTFCLSFRRWSSFFFPKHIWMV